MKIAYTENQAAVQKAAREFVTRELLPYADSFDMEQEVPRHVIQKVAQEGYLTPMIPQTYGGLELDAIAVGCLNEEVGRACSSIRSLLTVHGMVSLALLKWGSSGQKDRWLPLLTSGKAIAAFGLSEENAGSDVQGIQTRAERIGEDVLINGSKKWITFGQIADLYLVFAKLEDKPAVFLVDRATSGLTVTPIRNILGTRGSMLAELKFENCRVSMDHLIGAVGTGLSHVASSCLDYGRYSIAWGSVGSAQACLEASIDYTRSRKQFGKHLNEQQLIQKMLTEMIVAIKSAKLLCCKAGYLRDKGEPEAIMETWIAKYAASKAFSSVTASAVQLHGAYGISAESPVERHFRDARIIEIIEGTSQMHEIQIGSNAIRFYQ
ncbi:acyl-CoA dehydrogenase family protein [Paenibacillus sp. GbtcB18]|uniref:acyl-CoA dehydrogenase family protein n=1 Tax=Paenibacillus sp. GbtcB18 TaxID=2824763 RepID=UPI001C309F5D|nr:acyl-CoA dehydrogenase family protein [Paenibacillus sp. GbtcB18]